MHAPPISSRPHLTFSRPLASSASAPRARSSATARPADQQDIPGKRRTPGRLSRTTKLTPGQTGGTRKGPPGTPATLHPTRTARDAPRYRRTRPAALPDGEPVPPPELAHPAEAARRALLRVRSLSPPTHVAPSSGPSAVRVAPTKQDPEYARNGRGALRTRASKRPAHSAISHGAGGGLRSRVRRFESYWGRFFEQSFRIPELRRASLTCTSRTWRPTSLPMPARPATHVSPAAGHSTTEATARRVVPRHRAACPGMAHLRCGMSAVADLSILIYDRSPRRRGHGPDLSASHGRADQDVRGDPSELPDALGGWHSHCTVGKTVPCGDGRRAGSRAAGWALISAGRPSAVPGSSGGCVSVISLSGSDRCSPRFTALPGTWRVPPDPGFVATLGRGQRPRQTVFPGPVIA